MRRPPKSRYFTRPGSLNGLDVFARALDKPLEPMLARVGLTGDVFTDTSSVMPYAAVSSLLEACAAEWKIPDLGIQLGRMQSLEFLGPVGLVTRLCDTVGEAMQAVRLNMAVYSNAFTLNLDLGDAMTGDAPCISYQPKPDAGSGPQLVELSLCRIYQFLSIVSGVPALAALRVTFSHGPVGSATSASAFFGCPVLYNQPRNAIFFEASLLTAKTAVRDSAYAPVVLAYLEQQRERVESDMVEVTTRLIGQLLSTGHCTREAVADLLHMHPRTLHRRLQEQGTSFAAQLEDYRRSKAVEWVTQRHMPLTQVSIMLGYAHQSAFSAAYKRWCGRSPQSARASNPMRGRYPNAPTG